MTAACTLFLAIEAGASATEMCYYKGVISKVTKTHVHIGKLESVVSPGFNAEIEKLRCTGKLKNDRIPIKQLKKGHPPLKKGSKVKLEWHHYSAMTPKGAITTITWKIKSL